MLVSINRVNLRRARLVLGWVTQRAGKNHDFLNEKKSVLKNLNQLFYLNRISYNYISILSFLYWFKDFQIIFYCIK